MKQMSMVIDGQWGSTGKGLLAGYLAATQNPTAVVCNFGPNAGHTVRFRCGKAVMTQQLPTGILSSASEIFIGPGAIMDLGLLMDELRKFNLFMAKKTLYLHERMAVVSFADKETERMTVNSISSTCKGTGAAACRKIMRQEGSTMQYFKKDIEVIARQTATTIKILTNEQYLAALSKHELIQIESAQGIGLSLNVGTSFPYCTSRDVTPGQILCDCGIPIHWLKGNFMRTYCSMRTFPIRVGNVLDDRGEMIGFSGPICPDQAEISFEDLNVIPEKTTVTQKIRRIFTFSMKQLEMAKAILGNVNIFLNFVNYLSDGFDGGNFKHLVERIEDTGAKVILASDGPCISDVRERANHAECFFMRNLPVTNSLSYIVHIQESLNLLGAKWLPSVDSFMVQDSDFLLKAFNCINALKEEELFPQDSMFSEYFQERERNLSQ